MSPDILRSLRTIRHLEREQVAQRALRRLRPPPTPGAAPGGLEWDAAAWPRAPRAPRPANPAILEGAFEFWGAPRGLDLRRAWAAPDLGLSWNYPVHYFDAAPGLVPAHAARVQEWFDLWIAAHPPAQRPAWDAYPTALRIVNWLEVLTRLGAAAPDAWTQRVLQSLWVQADWLAKNLERHLLGTHLLKNAKALAIAGRVLTDPAAAAWRAQADAILLRELPRQVWPDGGLGEPSLPYHNMALEDMLDLLALRDWEAASWAALAHDTALRMLRFARAVQTPEGDAPLLGDSGEESVPGSVALAEYAGRLGLPVPEPGGGVQHFADSGIAVYRDARQYLLADVGGTGVSHLPGHGHCDSLSFEWWAGGRPIVVDTGTITYERGPARFATRCTAAHNTLQIDGQEQHEIWAAFRVARRSPVSSRLDSQRDVIAELVPWFDRRLRVARRFECSTSGVRIHDTVTGPGQHTLTSRLHLHPDCRIERDGDEVVVRNGPATAVIHMPVGFRILGPEASGSVHCERPGAARANPVLELETTGMLPWESAIRLKCGE